MLHLSWSLFLGLIFFARPVVAASAEQNKLSLSHTVFGTSSDYHSKSYDLASEIWEKKFIFNSRISDGTVFHKDFHVKSFNLGYRWNDLRSKPLLRAGAFNLDYRNKITSIGVVALSGEEFGEKLHFVYQIGYMPMSEEFQTEYTVREILRGGSIVVGGSYRWQERVRSTFYLQNFFFNDDNTRLNHDLGIFYGINTGDPWIWVGVGASRMSNTRTDGAYWVPLEFYNYGPRLDMAFSIFEKWRLVAGFNLNFFKDVKTGEGTGFYSMTRLYYKISPSFEAYTSIESIQSQQNGKIWKSNGVTVGLTGNW